MKIEEKLEKAFRKIEAKVEEMRGNRHIEKEIATSKGEYKVALAGLKQTIAAMIKPAIEETTAQALSPDPSSPFASLAGYGKRYILPLPATCSFTI